MVQHDEIEFSDQSQNYCVCIIDIVNSTLVTARMTNSDHIRKYYAIFINTMATIARNFEGKVIKIQVTAWYIIFQIRLILLMNARSEMYLNAASP